MIITITIFLIYNEIHICTKKKKEFSLLDQKVFQLLAIIKVFYFNEKLDLGVEPQRIKTTNSSKFKDYLKFIHKSCFIKNYRYSNPSTTDGHLRLHLLYICYNTTAFSQKLVLRILAKRFEFYICTTLNIYIVKIKFGCGFYPW